MRNMFAVMMNDIPHSNPQVTHLRTLRAVWSVVVICLAATFILQIALSVSIAAHVALKLPICADKNGEEGPEK
jgi:hypothetical protein